MTQACKAYRKAGFVGLGMMGLPLARLLASAADEVAVHDVRSAPLEAARASAGISSVRSAGNLAASCEIVFTCLPSPEAIRSVYLGEEGLIHSARAGLIVCELSTSSPELCAELHRALALRGAAYVEAMMIGPPAAAAAREVFFIASGDAALEPRVAPALTAMGRGFRWVGGIGSASRAKLLHNALGMIHAVAACEVLGLCLKIGVDPDAFVEIVRESPKSRGIGYSTFFGMHAADIVHGRRSGAGKLYIAAKDTALACSLGASVTYPTPLLDVAAAAFDEAVRAGWGEREFTAVAEVIEHRLGERIFGTQSPGAA